MTRDGRTPTQRRMAEEIEQGRRWVRYLREHPEAIPPEYRIVDRRTPAEKAAVLETLRREAAEFSARVERDLDLYHKGSHQPPLL